MMRDAFVFLSGACFGLGVALVIFYILRREAVRRVRQYQAQRAGATVQEMQDRAQSIRENMKGES